MKKLVSSLLVCTIAVMMSFSSLSVVQAKQQTHEEFLQEVERKLKNAGEYVYGGQSFTVSSSSDFLNYIRSGADINDQLKKDYLNDLKDHLNKYNGKIVATFYGNENENDLGLYGAVILVLKELEVNPENFEGYNIVNAFENVDFSIASANPYYYRLAIEAANPEYKIKITDQFIEGYYTFGKGMDNFGYSCDNTSMFLTSLLTVKDNYAQYVTDAKKIILNYEKENGFIGEEMYTNYVNSDSTAYAMMAFSAIGDVNQSYRIYSLLIQNFETENSGLFGYKDNQNVSEYSTKDAAISLYYFKEFIKNGDHVYTVVSRDDATCYQDGKEIRECMICGHQETTVLKQLDHQYVTTVVNPTVNNQGYTLHKCSLCGDEYKDQFVTAMQNSAIQSVDTSDQTNILLYVSAVIISGMSIIYLLRKKSVL